MYIGQWADSPRMMPVIAPYTGETIDEVPWATAEQIEAALSAAVRGAKQMAGLTAYERSRILNRAADLLGENAQDLASTISLEEGKPLTEARGEVSRMPDLLRLCAFEGTQLRGEALPLDAQVGAQGKLGFTLRVPCGVVLAITPFNYPLLLVVHKIAPALAAGNAVILKPADQTPLTSLKLTKILLEAGLPENGMQCITGPGHTIGPPLCGDGRVRLISFTGSTEVGKKIAAAAGIKKLALELGSNSPLVILPDADIQAVAKLTAIGGYVNAGQVCISVQRVLVHQKVYGDFIDALKPPVEAITTGPSLDETVALSSMISEQEAQRVETWIGEAVGEGASLVTGGQREGARLAPTIVADVTPSMRMFRDELFGPAVGITRVRDLEAAIALANDSDYGLGAGVFTRDVTAALRFAREVEAGNIMINWTPLWRADFMPYGGLKNSGIGKEGPRYAVEQMTESKTIAFHGLS